MARVISIINQKGGVGKTATATSLAAALNELGHKTLLIDADKQCNSTDAYRAAIDNTATLYDVILERGKHTVNINDAIQGIKGREIVAADPNLSEAEVKYSTDISQIYRLKEALADLDQSWEFVVIDTNPDLNKLLTACILGCQDIIVPVTPDKYPIDGLVSLVNNLDMLKKTVSGVDARICGILITRCPKAKRILKEQIMTNIDAAAEQMNTRVFKTVITERETMKQAQAASMTVIDFARNSETAKEYMQLAEEYLGNLKETLRADNG